MKSKKKNTCNYTPEFRELLERENRRFLMAILVHAKTGEGVEVGVCCWDATLVLPRPPAAKLIHVLPPNSSTVVDESFVDPESGIWTISSNSLLNVMNNLGHKISWDDVPTVDLETLREQEDSI